MDFISIVEVREIADSFDFISSGSGNDSATSNSTEKHCDIPATFETNIAITVVISVLLVLGVIGNVATIGVILRNKDLQTNFNQFLLSLCASDLVSACICSPLWLYRRTWGFIEWKWGSALCKFYWVSDFATDYTTSLHILSFCVLRYLAFSKPFTAPTSRFGKIHFRIYIASLWGVSVLLASPHIYFMDVREKNDESKDPWPSCSVGEGKKEGGHVYSIIAYSLFFYLPATCIIILNFLTTRILRNMKKSRALSSIRDAGRIQRIRQRNKAARTQLRLICACFLFGYVPVGVYHIWATKLAYDDCDAFVADYWFGVSSYIILRTSECLNPVMYNLGCTEMREATLVFVKSSILRQPSVPSHVPKKQQQKRSSPEPSPVETTFTTSSEEPNGGV